MRRIKLDKIDRQILTDLQDNGRMTNVDLARNADISAPPCLRRVRALEDAGLIRGYHADIDPTALGFTVTIFARVGLSSQADTDMREFEDLVTKWPLVRECYMIAGESDFILKIVAKDWESYQKFLTEDLSAAPKLDHIKSFLCVRTSKSVPGVPVELYDDSEDVF